AVAAVAERHPAAETEGRVELADLVALREVRVEVVLAVEAAQGLHTPLEREGGTHRLHDRARVEHRQHAGQPGVDHGDAGVRLAAEGDRGVREQLRRDVELDVDLEADRRAEAGDAHRAAPSSACTQRRAIARRARSRSGAAISCRPTGRPEAAPQGTEIAGMPARFAGTVSASARYIASGSSTS